MRVVLLLLLALSNSLAAANVGLLVMATGKYITFVDPLIKSANKHFLKKHKVTYYIFTDGTLPPRLNTKLVYQERLGWPFDTLQRYHVYWKNRELFQNEDYLFACDADMLFKDRVGSEILGDLVATIHPGFYNKRGSYETDPNSLACVNPDEGEHYFAGGFYGGARESFLSAIATNIRNIDDDYSRGLIAVWHDESHWNRYCIDHPPTVILSPSYCYPESVNIPFKKRLIALDKDHKEFRK